VSLSASVVTVVQTSALPSNLSCLSLSLKAPSSNCLSGSAYRSCFFPPRLLFTTHLLLFFHLPGHFSCSQVAFLLPLFLGPAVLRTSFPPSLSRVSVPHPHFFCVFTLMIPNFFPMSCVFAHHLIISHCTHMHIFIFILSTLSLYHSILRQLSPFHFPSSESLSLAFFLLTSPPPSLRPMAMHPCPAPFTQHTVRS